MATTQCYLLVEAEFTDSRRTKLKRVKVVRMVQTRPDPSTTGLWVKITLDLDDQVFLHLIPEFHAKLLTDQITQVLEQTSPLYMELITEDEDDKPE